MSPLIPDDSTRTVCRHCRLPVTPCRGIWVQWMHDKTQTEHCADEANLAEPDAA